MFDGFISEHPSGRHRHSEINNKTFIEGLNREQQQHQSRKTFSNVIAQDVCFGSKSGKNLKSREKMIQYAQRYAVNYQTKLPMSKIKLRNTQNRNTHLLTNR